MIYFLMHENDRIAVFEYENQNILALKIIEITSFKKREVELLQYVSNPMLVNISKLPSIDEVYQLFMKDSSANDEATLDKLTKAYQRKVEFLQQFQSGVKIFSYDYLKKHKVH